MITEGEIDCISVVQARGGYAVSVPNGAPALPSGANDSANDPAFRYLWGEDYRLLPDLAKFKRIVLATDNDGPGTVLRDELTRRLGPSRCWKVDWPEACKDANDVLLKFGPAAVKNMIERAKPISPRYGRKISEIADPPDMGTYSTGWLEMDRLIRVKIPELMIVTGHPTHGKSIWARALCCRLAKQHGWRSQFLMPEEPPHWMKRDLMRFAMNGELRLDDVQALAWLDEHIRIVTPPDDELVTLDFVKEEMRGAARHHGCKVFVLDPWNEVSHQRGGRPDTEYVAQALMELKALTRELALMLVLIAHPKKTEDDTAAPQAYDIAGSYNWFAKADHGVTIHRPIKDGLTVEVHQWKAKDNETMGRPGMIRMTWLVNQGDYYVG